MNQWPQWREKALAFLRQAIKRETRLKSTTNWRPREDHSDLAEIYLWEGDTETAWTEAKNGGCLGALWFRLAEAREKDHPEDALAVYGEQLKPALQWALPSAYEQVVDILRKIQKLMVRIGKQGEFASLLQSVRSQYKLRRNLIKLLDSQGW